MSSTQTQITLSTALAADIRRATHRILATLKATPEDKWDFKPSPTGKSIREIAQHAIEGNGYCAGPLQVPVTWNAEPSDSADILQVLETSGGALAAAAEQGGDAFVQGEVEFFGQKFTGCDFLQVTEWHISRHAGQIDYVQTLYGDLEDHGQ